MPNIGQVIQIHVGQAGVQIANACWELYCIEHCISINGCLTRIPEDDSYESLFYLTNTAKVVPRVVMVDSEPTVIDEIRTGCYRHLFHPDTLITGKEDSGSSFARGYYTIGSELIDCTMDNIRKVTESCNNLNGFLLFRAIGGGTGSAIGNLILEHLQSNYAKKTRLEVIIFPSPSLSPLIVEPYNALLATHTDMDISDCSFIMDNEALYDICTHQLNVSYPTYTNLNRIIAQGEIIHLHVGQAGVQIASACWELYCLEHGITSDGCMCAPEYINDTSYTTLFSYSCSHKLVPRLVMVDSEPTVIDEVRTGAYGHLFKPETLVNGKEDSGSNFGRGYNTIGSELVDVSVDAIRGVVEECSNLKGLIMFRAIGGGTGSGLGNRIMEQLADELGKKTKLDFIIFPSPSLSPLIVEPYNSLLATHIGMDTSNCTFIMDNEALYNICESKLGVCTPTYTNLNRIVAQATSALTVSQRFDGSMNVSFSELQTNLVPYPRIHFPLVSYAPLVTMGSACYSEFNTEKLTLECFQPSSQLVRCNPAEGKYMSCVLLYRGNVKPVDINSSIKILKSRNSVQFVDWSPTGFKIGVNSMPPYSVVGGDIGPTNQAMVGVANNTIIHKAWCRLLDKFNQLYKRRAFVHHYTSEGLEESIFHEASEDICTLISDYHEVQTKTFEGKHKSVNISTLDHVPNVKDEDLVAFPMSRTPWQPRLKNHVIEPKSEISEEDKTSDIDEDDPYHIESSNYEYETSKKQKSLSKQAADRKPLPNEIEYKSSTQSVKDEMDFREKADKYANLTLDQVDCHFLIYGNCNQGIPLRRSASELIHKHSTLGCHFKIQNGICQVVENDRQSPDLDDEISTGITKLQCYLNLCDKTCHCTIGQGSSRVPIEGAFSSSKTELRRLESDKT